MRRVGERSRPVPVVEDVLLLRLGRGPTASNVYLVGSGEGWALVDTGWAHGAEQIRSAAEAVFGTGTRPAAIILTHLHPDHSGSVLDLARIWNTPVYAHPAELPAAAGGVLPEYANPLDRWLIGPVLRLVPRDTLRRALAKNSLERLLQPLPPGGAVPGLPEWEAVPTPGHTPGHTAFFRRRDGLLITGDAVVSLDLNRPWNLLRRTTRPYGPPYISTWRWPTAMRSIADLAGLEPRILAPGHGRPVLAGVAPALRALAGRTTPCPGGRRRPLV